MADRTQANLAGEERSGTEVVNSHASLSGSSTLGGPDDDDDDDDTPGHPREAVPTNKWFNIVTQEDEDGDVSKCVLKSTNLIQRYGLSNRQTRQAFQNMVLGSGGGYCSEYSFEI